MLRTELAQVDQADFGTAPLPDAAAEDSIKKEVQDFPLVIATMPATERQRAIAVGCVILLAVASAVIAPFREHTGRPRRCLHSGFADRRERCRSYHGGPPVCSIFDP